MLWGAHRIIPDTSCYLWGYSRSLSTAADPRDRWALRLRHSFTSAAKVHIPSAQTFSHPWAPEHDVELDPPSSSCSVTGGGQGFLSHPSRVRWLFSQECSMQLNTQAAAPTTVTY